MDSFPWSFTSGATDSQAPRAICCASLVSFGDKLGLFGGGIIGWSSRDFHVFDTVTGKWENVQTVNSEIVAPRLSHTAVVLGNSMYVYAGMNHLRIMNDMLKLDLTTMEWSHVEPKFPYPPPRRSHAAVVYEGEMYMLMGSLSHNLKDFWKYDPQKDAWTELVPHSSRHIPGYPPLGLAGHCAEVVNDTMLVFGGLVSSREPSTYSGALYAYGFKTGVWQEILMQGPSPTPRYSSIMWCTNSTVSIHGGDCDECRTYFSDTWTAEVFDAHGNVKPVSKWEEQFNYGNAPCNRSGHSATSANGVVYFFGGEAPYSAVCTDVVYSRAVYKKAIALPKKASLKELTARWLSQCPWVVAPREVSGQCWDAAQKYMADAEGAEVLTERLSVQMPLPPIHSS